MILHYMCGSLELRTDDQIAKEFYESIRQLYSNEGWSRFVPKRFQSDGYTPVRLSATERFNGTAKLNIICQKELDNPKFFLGIIAISTPKGDIEIKSFLTEVPEQGIVHMQDEEHGTHNKKMLNKTNISSKERDSFEVMYESISEIENMCNDLESKSVEELILDT